MVDKTDDLNIYARQEKPVEKKPTTKDNTVKSSDAIEQNLNSDLSWLSNRYREVTNTSSKDVRLGEVEDFRKFVAGNPIAEKVFQRLKNSGLKIYTNDKTDISFTHKFNIIMGMSDNIIEESKYTMNLDKNATAYDVHKTKFIHEMCHSLVMLQEEMWMNVFKYCLAIRKADINITALGNLSRYKTLEEKAREDTVELLRMYIQNSDNLKKYLSKIFKNEKTVELIFGLVRDCINAVIEE